MALRIFFIPSVNTSYKPVEGRSHSLAINANGPLDDVYSMETF
jgi:hypothetical protein